MKSGADNGDGFGGWSLIDAEMRLQYASWETINFGRGSTLVAAGGDPEMP